MEKCADVKDRVDLNKSGSAYCKMCYRNTAGGGTKKERLKKCNNSRLGCSFCKETICDDCWNSGYDQNQK